MRSYTAARPRHVACGLPALVCMTITVVHAQAATPIQQQYFARNVPEFIGEQAKPEPIATASIPQNPFMAPNGRSSTHDDAYASDTYEIGGSLGDDTQVSSAYLGSQVDPIADCVTMTFDSKGRITTVCPGLSRVPLYLLDPDTLDTLTTLDLPPRAASSFNDIGGGAYFYLDNEDRAVIPTANSQIWVVKAVEDAAGPKFETQRIYHLENALPEGEAVASVLPDWTGRLWFVTGAGRVGTVDPDSGKVLGIYTMAGEEIANSFAVDEMGGVFIASDHAMYRFDAGPGGAPIVTWREAYDRGTRVKPGQLSQGTGTTPTLMGTDYVTITDNAEPRMHVLVYKRAADVSGDRLVCTEPVFQPGKSATENSLIATDRSIIVENNYGYSSPLATTLGRTTTPGLTRIDLAGGGCHTVWENEELSIPSVVSKLSLANGLIYTYTKPEGPGLTDAWYFTTVDFYTGERVFSRLAGTGIGYNNHYAALYLGPDGETTYVGTLEGLVAMRPTHGGPGLPAGPGRVARPFVP